MGRLEGRVAFITGAGRGIGAATALRMAEEGARVVLADVDTEGCKQVSAELDRLGSEGLVIPCNVADSAVVQDAIDKAARGIASKGFGKLYRLIDGSLCRYRIIKQNFVDCKSENVLVNACHLL